MSEQQGEDAVSAELGERVRSIVAAAEGMAAAVREDADRYAEARRREADADAERRLQEASERAEALLAERLSRMSDLADRIIERAEVVLTRLDEAGEVRRQLGTLANALGETADRLASELGEGVSGHVEEHPMEDQVRPLRPPGEQAPRPLRPITAPHVARGDETRLDDARLVALQMAVAGRTREEVAEHLRQAFDVEDPGPILDHVFADGFPPSPATS